MSRSCSSERARKTMISSIRLMNSGLKPAAKELHQLLLQLVEVTPLAGELLDPVGADVGGHDHDGVLEVDGPALGVGEAASSRTCKSTL